VHLVRPGESIKVGSALLDLTDLAVGALSAPLQQAAGSWQRWTWNALVEGNRPLCLPWSRRFRYNKGFKRCV